MPIFIGLSSKPAPAGLASGGAAVGSGGIGFQLLTAMNLFGYRQVSLLLIIFFVIVLLAECLSAICRERLA